MRLATSKLKSCTSIFSIKNVRLSSTSASSMVSSLSPLEQTAKTLDFNGSPMNSSSFMDQTSKLSYTNPLNEYVSNNILDYSTTCKLSNGKECHVTYTNSVLTVNEWIHEHVISEGVFILGLDTETRPAPYRMKNVNKISTLQLSTLTHSLVIHLNNLNVPETLFQKDVSTSAPSNQDEKMNDFLLNPTHDDCLIGLNQVGIPSVLHSLLHDARYTVVGCSIHHDVKEIGAFANLRTLGDHKSMRRVELADMLRELQLWQLPSISLAKLAHWLLNVDSWKSVALTMSNWESFPLRLEQITYAALDAWISVQCYHELVAIQEKRSAAPPLTEELNAILANKGVLMKSSEIEYIGRGGSKRAPSQPQWWSRAHNLSTIELFDANGGDI